MNIAVPSRFACLKIEEDDIKQPKPGKESKQKTSKKEELKQNAKKKNAGAGQSSGSKPQGKKDKKVKQHNEKQWEEWQQKDSELVDGNFESDLQNAILLSKLDYEEKKELYEMYKKSAEIENKKGDGKKKKNKVMTLDQFLASQNVKAPVEEKLEACNLDKGDFFTNVQNDAQIELNKDLVLVHRKERNDKVDENISIAQYQVKLEKEQSANEALKKELAEAHLEIQECKKHIAEMKVRNKQLCAILGQGEMKDKAGVLLELQRLDTVKTELTEEVERLHGLLEKERSKNMNNNEHSKHKEKKNKKQ